MANPICSTTCYTNCRANSRYDAHFPVRYTRALDKSGWLKVKMEQGDPNTVLCEYTKVLITAVKGGRVYFLIKEGPHANKKASLSSENAEKALMNCTRGTGAKLIAKTLGRKVVYSPIRAKYFPNENPRYNQLLATLSFNGMSAHITLDSNVQYKEENRNSPHYHDILHSKPLPKGTYRIFPPDYPKKAGMTSIYKDQALGYPALCYDTAWFPVEYAPNLNSNFVHVGHLSEGCITCYEIQKWNDLYLYLIRNRTADGKYVGTVTIL